MEDFTGQNYLEVKGKIEAGCECNVLVETKKVDEKEKAKEETVLETVPPAGESVKLGTAIKIIIPEIEYKYPDFTSGYTLAQIEEYCAKHEVTLQVKYKESSTMKEGTIVSQSRAKGTVVSPGATIVITVSKKPDVAQPEVIVPEDEVNNNSGE